METIYFKRKRNIYRTYSTLYYKDIDCLDFICLNPYVAKTKNHIATINGVEYNAIKGK